MIPMQIIICQTTKVKWLYFRCFSEGNTFPHCRPTYIYYLFHRGHPTRQPPEPTRFCAGSERGREDGPLHAVTPRDPSSIPLHHRGRATRTLPRSPAHHGRGLPPRPPDSEDHARSRAGAAPRGQQARARGRRPQRRRPATPPSPDTTAGAELGPAGSPVHREWGAAPPRAHDSDRPPRISRLIPGGGREDVAAGARDSDGAALLLTSRVKHLH
jgi:hypothetical protein